MIAGAPKGEGTSSVRIDLGRLAERDPLALEIKRRVLAHPVGSLGERALTRMWGTVVVVRRDPPATGLTLRELTLRFDYGRLVVHDGRVGRPHLSLWGTDAEVLSLGEALVTQQPTRAGVSAWTTLGRWWTVGRLVSRSAEPAAGASRLQIFGGLAHPRLLYRLALVLTDQAAPSAP